MTIKAFAISATAFLLSAVIYASQADKPKVFVKGTDPGGGSTAAETTGSLVKACPELTITLDRDQADYTVVRDLGTGWKVQKLTVFNHNRDLIYSGNAHTVTGAAKDACTAIRKDLKSAQSH